MASAFYSLCLPLQGKKRGCFHAGRTDLPKGLGLQSLVNKKYAVFHLSVNSLKSAYTVSTTTDIDIHRVRVQAGSEPLPRAVHLTRTASTRLNF